MTTYTLVAKNFYSSNFISPVFSMPSGFTQARVKVVLTDVDISSPTTNIFFEQSLNAGETWQVISTASIQPPDDAKRKDSSTSEFAVQNFAGLFRVRSELTGTIGAEVSVLAQ